MSTCPKGHDSKTDDYCDECGAPMNGPGAAHSGQASVPTCPECGTDRESGARFCEICQYDFAKDKPGSDASGSRLARSDALARQALAGLSPPGGAVPSAQASQNPQASAPAKAAFGEVPLLARVVSDASLCPDDEARKAFPPEGIPEFIFHLDLDENLVGRDSASKNSHPEIPVRDPGASRRHLKLARIGGRFQALDQNSSNGSMLDGAPLTSGSPMPIGPGSVIRLGMWTTILIEAR